MEVRDVTFKPNDSRFYFVSPKEKPITLQPHQDSYVSCAQCSILLYDWAVLSYRGLPIQQQGVANCVFFFQKIGKLFFDPRKGCLDDCYAGFRVPSLPFTKKETKKLGNKEPLRHS